MMVHLSSPKGDISTLEKRGHFYFGLTEANEVQESQAIMSMTIRFLYQKDAYCSY